MTPQRTALLALFAVAALSAHACAPRPSEMPPIDIDPDTDQSEHAIGADEAESASSRVYWRDESVSGTANTAAWVRFKILGINDFHGQLSRGAVAGRPAGGAAVLASYLRAAAAGAEHGAVIVHAGDHVGASPPNSALLQDEPAIGFLNLLANDKCSYQKPFHSRCNLVGTLGNHEFDEGVAEMLRLVEGGNHASGPFLEPQYGGAQFPYVSANVVYTATGEPVLPPYAIKRVRGMPVAFIGAVLKETPTIVIPSGVASVTFLDEADAINSYIGELRAKNVRAIIVTIHQGTRDTLYLGPTRPEPRALAGAIGDIVARLDDEVDLVVSGHAHGFTNALVPNHNGKVLLVSQAFSAATAFADIDLAIDPETRDIVEKSASIVTTFADVGPGLEPAADVADLVARADARVAPLVSRVIGVAATDILTTPDAAGESALGNLIADAQRAAMATDFAFMNPGGIRTNIAAGEVTWGELFAVQPFANDLVKMDLSGEQVVRLLNQQWVGQDRPRITSISGLTYIWDEALPVGDRIVSVHTAAGDPLSPTAVYTVTVNSFMAAGGDRFTVLIGGLNRVIGPVDLEALVTYIQSLPQPFTAIREGRIERRN